MISKTFPDLTVRSLTLMCNIKANDVYIANNEIVFKIPNNVDNPSCLSVEYRVLCALRGKVSGVPQPLYFGTLPDGRLILGISLIQGVQFSSEIYDSLTEAEQDDVYDVRANISNKSIMQEYSE